MAQFVTHETQVAIPADFISIGGESRGKTPAHDAIETRHMWRRTEAIETD